MMSNEMTESVLRLVRCIGGTQVSLRDISKDRVWRITSQGDRIFANLFGLTEDQFRERFERAQWVGLQIQRACLTPEQVLQILKLFPEREFYITRIGGRTQLYSWSMGGVNMGGNWRDEVDWLSIVDGEEYGEVVYKSL